MKASEVAAIATCVLALAACGGGGGSVGQFVDGCVESTNLGEELCECIAALAEDELSSDGFQFLLASMTDESRASELRHKLDMQEAMQAGMFMTSAPARCAKEEAGG